MSMDNSINAPQQKGNQISEWVWFDGIIALQKGQAVSYEFDYLAPVSPANTSGDTAATNDGRRTNRVVLPVATGGGRWFAGVCAANYPAQTSGSKGYLIEIFTPGSTCLCLVYGVSTTIGQGLVTVQVGGVYAGYFTTGGFEGAGSAVPLVTVDTTANSNAAQLILCRLQVGTQSGGVEVLGTSDVASTYYRPGMPTTLVTQTTAGTGTAGGARQSKVGGLTIYTTATNASAITTTLANGTYIGQQKAFTVSGTQTTNGVTVTVTTGKKTDGTTNITTLVSSTANTTCLLQWGGVAWELISIGGWTVT